MRHPLFLRTMVAMVLGAGLASNAQTAPAGNVSAPPQASVQASDKNKATPTAKVATTGALANVVTGPPPAGARPWTGSFILYGHNMTALTLNKAAEPYYNPTYYHQLDLRPQWNLGTRFFLRGRLAFTQEFTLSDDTTYKNEVVLSDTWVDFGWRGTKIPVIDANITAGFRTLLPTSKTSYADTMIVGFSPGVQFIKSLPVWGGLTLLADVRVTRFFHRFTTSQLNSPAIDTCGDINALSCNNFIQTGTRNASTALGYGGGFALSANDRLSFSSQFRMSHSFLYPLSDSSRLTSSGELELPKNEGTQMRHIWGFFFDVNYQLTPAFSLSAGAWTFSNQLAADSTYRNPFFNRFTMLHVDVGISVDELFPKS